MRAYSQSLPGHPLRNYARGARDVGMSNLPRSDRWSLIFFFATACLGFLAWAFPNMSRIVTMPGATLSFIFMLYFLWPEVKAIHSTRRQRMLPLIGMIACGIGFLGFAAWYFWPTIPANSAKNSPVETTKEVHDVPHLMAPKPASSATLPLSQNRPLSTMSKKIYKCPVAVQPLTDNVAREKLISEIRKRFQKFLAMLLGFQYHLRKHLMQ